QLPVRAGLEAAEHAPIAIVAGTEAAEIIVARERAADMGAEIESGPVVERWRVDWRLLVGPAIAEIGGVGRERRAEGRDRDRREQNLLHGSTLQHKNLSGAVSAKGVIARLSQ